MQNQEQLISDPAFLKIAYRMGYQKTDLQEINEYKIEVNSAEVMKNMSDIEKKFYIRKKVEALNARREGIFKKVYQQYLKTANKSIRTRKSIFNPIVSDLLTQHQHILEKKARYDEIVRVSKSRNSSNRYKYIRNTVDLGRTSPNFGQISRYSQQSRKTVQSSSSSRNSQLSRTSHKMRLELVRNKQREIEKYKKQNYLSQQEKSNKKIDKVYFQRQSQSRKIKTRSQISRQAARQKKAELNYIKNQENKHRIENMQYKMIKHEMLKEKQIQDKLQSRSIHDGNYVKQVKHMFDKNDYLKKKITIESKMRTAEQKKRELEAEKKRKLETKIQERKYKELYSNKYKHHKQLQIADRNRMTLYHEQKSLQQAQKKRQQHQSEKKIRILENKVRQEIVKNNLNTIQRRRNLQKQNKIQQYSQKINQIKEIEKLKKQLTNQRVHYQRKSRDYSLY